MELTASYYDERFREGYADYWPQERYTRVAALIKSLDLPQTGTALDFGCGNGSFTKLLADTLPGWTVVGADLSSVAVANCLRKYPALTFLQIFAVAAMAANAKDALDSRSSAGFAAAYAAVRFVLVAQYIRARHVSDARALTLRYGTGHGTAALLWLSFYQVVFWGTAQRVDAPAICFEVVGLAIAVGERGKNRTPWAALPMFVLAWATKQVMVVGLVAVTIDLLVRDRAKGLRFAGTAAASLATTFLLLSIGTHGAFQRATFSGTVSAHADPPWVIFSNAELFFGSPWNMLLFVLAGGAAYWRRDLLLGLYLGLGLVFAIATDANFPRFFPPMAAMAILVPLLLHDAASRPTIRQAVLATLVFFGGAHLLYEMRSLVKERIVNLRADGPRLTVANELAAMTPASATILAQDLGMVLSAKRTPAIADPLVMSILAGNGAWNPRILAAGIEERRYDAIVLNRPVASIDDTEWTTLWIAPSRQEIATHYRLAKTLHFDATWRFLEPDRYVYVPKEAP